MANLEIFAGSPGADDLSALALALGQEVDAGEAEIERLFVTRGLAHARANRRAEAVCYLEHVARVADDTGNYRLAIRALVNLSDALAATSPSAAAEPARTAAAHARRTGDRYWLAVAVHNLVTALMAVGDWEEADGVIAQALGEDALEDEWVYACHAWFAALRGDLGTARKGLASMGLLKASEDPQDQAMVAAVEAFMAEARGEPGEALRHANTVIANVRALGVGAEHMRWLWPLAARAAETLGDTATIARLLATLDMHPPGHLPPILRAERELTRARAESSEGATAAMTGAVDHVRRVGSPYHLGHALLDLAAHLARHGEPAAAKEAIDESRVIAERLRCRPLAERAASAEAAQLATLP